MSITNTELEYRLRKFPGFDGVFSIDQLPKWLDVGHGIIINFEPHTMGGSHWVSAVNREGFGKVYIDPFGLPPPTIIHEFLMRGPPGEWFCYNTRQYQTLRSQACGAYAYHFLKNFFEGKPIFGNGLVPGGIAKNNSIVRRDFNRA